MKKYKYEVYDINGEVIGGGHVYALNEIDAGAKIEVEIENNSEEWTEAGYFNHKITGESD